MGMRSREIAHAFFCAAAAVAICRPFRPNGRKGRFAARLHVCVCKNFIRKTLQERAFII